MEEFKFCAECGEKIAKNAAVCPKCGCSTAPAAAPNIIINNSNQNQASVAGAMVPGTRMKNKWVALILEICFGALGAHKFYEGKVGLGILYLFTFGLFGIGCFIDFWTLLFKPNPYYVL